MEEAQQFHSCSAICPENSPLRIMKYLSGLLWIESSAKCCTFKHRSFLTYPAIYRVVMSFTYSYPMRKLKNFLPLRLHIFIICLALLILASCYMFVSICKFVNWNLYVILLQVAVLVSWPINTKAWCFGNFARHYGEAFHLLEWGISWEDGLALYNRLLGTFSNYVYWDQSFVT